MTTDKSGDRRNTNSSLADGLGSKYFETTTIHGISPIFTSKNFYQRFIWSSLFIAAFGLLIWQVSELVVKVSRKGITIEATTMSKEELNFPRITICNINPYSKSKMKEFLLSTFSLSINELNDGLKQHSVLRAIGGFSASQNRIFAHDYQDFAMMKLNLCRFDNEPCQPTDIILDGGILVGNCVRFNHLSNLRQKQAGPLFGLSMTLNVNEEDYLPLEAYENSGSGILVQIVKDNLPMESYTIRNEGIAAAPGTLTKIKLKRKEIRRLPYPYPDACMVDTKVNALGEVKFKYYGDYTVRWCRLACVWTNQMKVCGFVSSEYKSVIEEIVDREKTKISFSNSTDANEIKRELKCLHRAASAVNGDEEACNCKPYCFEEDYGVQLSTSKWPTSNQAGILLNRMKTTWPNSSSIQNWTTENIYKNLVKVEIYYSDLLTQRIEQIPAYNWNEFLSDLGGQVGLWIGASVYSIFELCTLLLIPLKGIKKIWSRNKKQVSLV